MPIDNVDYVSLQAMSFTRTICKVITAPHIAIDARRAEKIQQKKQTYGPNIKLVIVESPLRAFMQTLLTYVDMHYRQHPYGFVTIVFWNSLRRIGGRVYCIIVPPSA